MSERLFKFLLTELKTVRLICPHCTGVIEVSVKELGKRFDSNPACPLCSKPFVTMEPGPDKLSTALGRLADAILELQHDKRAVKVEFVLPDNG